MLKRIQTRSNLSMRGINISLDLCPVCSNEVETEEHLFHSCTGASEIWKWFFNWCNLKMEQYATLDLLLPNLIDRGKTAKERQLLEADVGCILWFVWKARNNVVFNNKNLSATMVMDDVQASLYTWIKYRGKISSVLWCNWCCNPLSSL